jgi:glycosyltransferase involved in cell wall biosynthesis
VRVAIIGSPWIAVPPVGYGGTEAVLDGLVRGLADAGHEVAFVGHPDSSVPVHVISCLQGDQIGTIGETVCEAAHVAIAYDQAVSWGADVIHDHTLLGGLLNHTSTPVIVTNHGPFSKLTTPVYERIARRAAVVAISHDQAASAPSVPVTAVVHHGIDVSGWPVGSGDGDYLLFLGRMHPTKGVHRAIDLARAAGVPLVLAAKMQESAEFAYFEEEVRPRLHGDAHFVGEADAETKRRLLAGARALLNPISWAEPFGMVMVEALACGTPVLVPPVGAAVEIVDDGVTGFLCPTPRSFLSAIDAVGSLDRGRCRAVVAERFPVSRMVAGYERLYDAAVAGARDGSSRRVSAAPSRYTGTGPRPVLEPSPRVGPRR